MTDDAGRIGAKALPSDEERLAERHATHYDCNRGKCHPNCSVLKLARDIKKLVAQVRAEASQEKDAEIERLNETCTNLKSVLRSDEEQAKQWAKRHLEMQNDVIRTAKDRDLERQHAEAAEAERDALREQNERSLAEVQHLSVERDEAEKANAALREENARLKERVRMLERALRRLLIGIKAAQGGRTQGWITDKMLEDASILLAPASEPAPEKEAK